MNLFDCIIVGAGPGGGSAAYHLAKQGHSVLAIEKATLPRYKPCGGGVSPVVQQWFDFDFSPAISCQTTTICYTWNQGDAVEVDLENIEPIWMVRRDVFDHFLIQQGQKQGVTLWDGTKATGISWQSDRWEVQTTKGTVAGRYLIAADGGKGSTAKWLGFKRRKTRMAGALEVELPISQQSERKVYFEFGMINGGYMWNFPKADGYSIGVGTFRGAPRQDFRNIVADYSQMFEVDIDRGMHWGHPIYLWDGIQRLHTQNALLAGEAACVVDPFTAEGIRPSMWSGIKAAEAIHGAIGGDRNALENYSRVMAQSWGTQMKWAKRLAQIFYRFPQTGYQLGVKRPTATKTMCKILAGELHYSDVTSRALKRLMP